MPYQFLVDTYETECIKVVSVWSEFKDDDLEVLKKRMLEYHEKSEPLIEYYALRGLLKRIDANGSLDDVFAQISNALNEL